VAPQAPGLGTVLADEQPASTAGLSGADGIPGAGSPEAAEVIGAQSLQPEADGALAGAEDPAMAPDTAGFPMMGTGGAAQPEDQERIRQAWLNSDDLWRLSAPLVPPLIDQ
jgi:hypothetical protein